MKNDPGELVNLAETEKEKAQAYKALLNQRMQENHDFCNLDNPLWWKDAHKLTWEECQTLYLFDK